MSDPADLSNLRDIVMPPPVSFWPPPPGWWILAVALLAVLAIALARVIARYRRNAYRRAALCELETIGQPDDCLRAQLLSSLLKRTALVAYPREQIASLSGGAWLAFLDETRETDAFTNGAARQLTALTFGAVAKSDGATILAEARRWIRHHKCPDERRC
jgi:hypothetical protein